MIYLTEDLVTAVKTSSLAPVSQGTFTDPDDFITLLNEEMQLYIVPLIMSVREEFFAVSKDVSLVANIDKYGVPERSIGNTIQNLFFIDGGGYNRGPLSRIMSNTIDLSLQSGNTPGRFYFQGDDIVILPKPTSGVTGSLRLIHYQRPNKLVQTSSCAKITAVSTASGTTTFTVNTDLSASLSVGSVVDFLKAKSPFKLQAQDVAITAITSTTIAVSATDVQDANSNVLPVVGDYICAAQTANIPQIPQELHPLLAQRVILRLMQPLGDSEKYKIAADVAERMEKAALMLISNRAEAQVQKVNHRNSFVNFLGGRTSNVSNVR